MRKFKLVLPVAIIAAMSLSTSAHAYVDDGSDWCKTHLCNEGEDSGDSSDDTAPETSTPDTSSSDGSDITIKADVIVNGKRIVVMGDIPIKGTVPKQ